MRPVMEYKMQNVAWMFMDFINHVIISFSFTSLSSCFYLNVVKRNFIIYEKETDV